MSTNNQEASIEVAIVDKVDTAAAVQIATTSKEKDIQNTTSFPTWIFHQFWFHFGRGWD